MASSSIDILVDDDSPTIAYLPFRDSLSVPDFNAGWNPFFNGSGFASSPGEKGNGTSYHATALNGATLTISWQGTGIRLSGQANNISFITILDGDTTPSAGFDASQHILAAFPDLPRSNHSLTLQVVTSTPPSTPPTSGLYFDSALLTTSPPMDDLSNLTFANTPLDVNNLAFIGRWSFTEAQEGSFYASATKGDRVRTRFQGSSLQLFGATSLQSGLYSVTLDNVTTTLSARSSFTNNKTLLYFATGLSLDVFHDVEVENLDASLSIASSGFLVGVPQESTPLAVPPPPVPSNSTAIEPDNSVPFSSAAKAAFALGGILAFLLLTALLWFFFVYRRRRHRHYVPGQREPPEKRLDAGEVVDITRESIPDPYAARGRWDIDRGRRSLRNLGIAFRTSPPEEEGKAEGMNDTTDDAKEPDIPGPSGRAKGGGVPIVPIINRWSSRTRSSWASIPAIDLGNDSISRSDSGGGQSGIPQSPISLTTELAALSNPSSPVTAAPDTSHEGTGNRVTGAAIMTDAPYTAPLPHRSHNHVRGKSTVPLLQYRDDDHEPTDTAEPYNPYAAVTDSNANSELLFTSKDTSLGFATGHEGTRSTHQLPTIAKPIQPQVSQELKRPIRKLPDIPVAKTTLTTTPAPAIIGTASLRSLPVDPPSNAADVPASSSLITPPPRSIFRLTPLTPHSVRPPPHPLRPDSTGDQSYIDNSAYLSRSDTMSTIADSRHRNSASTVLTNSVSFLSYAHGRKAQAQNVIPQKMSMRLSAVPPVPPSPPPVPELPARSALRAPPPYTTHAVSAALAQQPLQQAPQRQQQDVPYSPLESPDQDVSPLSLIYPRPPFLRTRFSHDNFGFLEVDAIMSTTTVHPPYQFPLPPISQTPQQQQNQQLQNPQLQQQPQNQQTAQQAPALVTTNAYSPLDSDAASRWRRW